MSKPKTRASYAKGVLDEVAHLDAAPRAAIRASAGPSSIRRIEDAVNTEWIEAEAFDGLTEAIRKVLGDDGTRRLFRQLGRKLARAPALQSAIDALVRTFGLNPHTLLKFAPKGRAAMVLDSGSVTYTKKGAKVVDLVLEGYPASTFRNGTTTVLLAGTWEGILDLCQVEGTVVIAAEDLELGNATWTISWS
ncbi:MAG: hypothetical protein Q8O67_03420 [Deltaproteobacteria bacterium]|nr:hypothetical protein [Deltaproteobacteria bacterium]